MAITIGVSLQPLIITIYAVAVSPVVRGSSNLQDALLPLPPGELSLGLDATPFEKDLVRWANDITSRLQELLKE